MLSTGSESRFPCSVAGIDCTESEHFLVSGGAAGEGCGIGPRPLVSLRENCSLAGTL